MVMRRNGRWHIVSIAVYVNGESKGANQLWKADCSQQARARQPWVVGDLYTVKASGRETGGASCLIEAIVPPQSGPPPHIHQGEDESFYIIEGQCTVSINGKELTAGPGTGVRLAKGSLHHFKKVNTFMGKMLILATPTGLDEFFLEAGTEATSPPFEFKPPTDDEVQRLLSVAPKFGIEVKLPAA